MYIGAHLFFFCFKFCGITHMKTICWI